MANDGFNGSVLKFQNVDPPTTVVAKLRSVRFSEAAPLADVSDITDTRQTFTVGVPEFTCSAQVVGAAAGGISRGDLGFLDMDWFDGTTDDGTGNATEPTWLCSSRETAGELDGEVVTDLEFVVTVT